MIVIILLTASLGYGGYSYWLLHSQKISLENQVRDLGQQLTVYQTDLSQAKNENTDLTNALNAEKERVNSLGEQVGEITDTVGDLEKLSRLDPELLQKYSKVYFLNEHYIPDRLTNISSKYLYNTNSPQRIHARVWPRLEDLLGDASDDNIALQIISAYRSFGDQTSLKADYGVVYGSGANQFSADQGYSEHQLGTTVDFATPGTGALSASFEATTAYQWLLNNAHKYGFVLSYPQGNAYYQFEPWHWRFVGTDLARDLHRDNLNFYDMDQRKIDEYLLNIFD